MSAVLLVLVVFLASCQGQQARGIDVSEPVSATAARCLRSQGFQFAIVRAFRSNGLVDANAVSSISNLQAAGFSVAAYMFPCPRCSSSPEQQMRALLQALSGVSYTRIWLDIEQASTYWRDVNFNRNFLSRLMAAAGSTPLGIYANWNGWREAMGTGFHAAQSLPLWYPHYNDNGQTLSDFQSFGGWSGPVARQYSETGRSCGVGYDVNWTPDEGAVVGSGSGRGGSSRPTPPPRSGPSSSGPRAPSSSFAPRCVQTGGRVNVRRTPNGVVVGSLPAGSRVTVSSASGAWYRVPGGWSFAQLFRPCSTAVAPSPSSPRSSSSSLVCARVNANMRATASMQGRVVRVATKGARMQVLGRSGNWLRLRAPSGVVGFSYYNLYSAC